MVIATHPLDLLDPSQFEAFEAALPQPVAPVGSYVPWVQSGNLIYTSGALPMRDGVLMTPGAVGGYDVLVAQGQLAAKQCAINTLAVLKQALGSLRHIKQVVKLTGYVQSAQGFYKQPLVINGASDLLVALFGPDIGKHARSAVGVYALPLNAPVEIDLVVEV
jgi:enamine deaminase RidA (YjgF/YER057c/UK114 family)